jgi:hypothetical protein
MTPEQRDEPQDEPQIMRDAGRILFGLGALVVALALGTWAWRIVTRLIAWLAPAPTCFCETARGDGEERGAAGVVVMQARWNLPPLKDQQLLRATFAPANVCGRYRLPSSCCLSN